MAGATVGRKPAEIDHQRLVMLLGLGVSKAHIARTLKIGSSTLYRYLKRTNL